MVYFFFKLFQGVSITELRPVPDLGRGGLPDVRGGGSRGRNAARCAQRNNVLPGHVDVLHTTLHNTLVCNVALIIVVSFKYSALTLINFMFPSASEFNKHW